MNDVSAVQHDPGAAAALGALWELVGGRSADFAVEEYAARREVIARSFSAQLEACVASFHRLSDLAGTELTPRIAPPRIDRGTGALSRSIGPMRQRASGLRAIAISSKRRWTVPTRHVFRLTARSSTQLAAWLGERATARKQRTSAIAQSPSSSSSAHRSPPRRSRTRRSTAMDVCSRATTWASKPTCSASKLRLSMRGCCAVKPISRMRCSQPRRMTTSVVRMSRARLAVLSEKTEEWASLLPNWIERCRPLRRQSGDALLPHGGDIAMLLQTIVGAWPLDLEVEECWKGGVRLRSDSRAGRKRRCAKRSLRPTGPCQTTTYESAARHLTMALVADNAAA